MPKVLITGGTGSIGTYLSNFLEEKGYEVAVLSRGRSAGSELKTYLWNYKEDFIEPEALETADYIVHMAGAGIADKRWTNKRKKEIIESRVATSELLYRALAKCKNKPKAFISASGIGYYGQQTTDRIFKETDPAGNDFVGETCRLWEASVNKINGLGIKTINLRIGVVMMKNGGALEKMAQPIRMGVGAALGSGKQMVPWIHIADLNRIILHAINNTSMEGAYNTCVPEPVTNIDLTKTLAKVLHKKLLLPNTPAWVLKIILGERSVLLTEGSRVSSDKILSTGFKFKFTNLENALQDILG